MLCLQVTTLKSLNDALNCLDVSVRPSNPKFPSDPAGHWNVLDGRALLRYKDGLVGLVICPCMCCIVYMLISLCVGKKPLSWIKVCSFMH